MNCGLFLRVKAITDFFINTIRSLDQPGQWDHWSRMLPFLPHFFVSAPGKFCLEIETT